MPLKVFLIDFMYHASSYLSSGIVSYSDRWPVYVYDTCGKSSRRFTFLVQISLLYVVFAVSVAFIVDLVVGHVYSTSTLAW